MLTHSLLQAVCSGGLQVWQVPSVQMSFDPQTLPQVPQLFGSAFRSTQSVPHRVWPDGQIGSQLPCEQYSSAAHWLPQAPQLSGSPRRS